MKKSFAILIFLLYFTISFAQIPYFSGTVGNNKLYGYTSIKFRPGNNVIETYTTFQYGITNYAAAGLDLYTSGKDAYWGLTLRGGYKFNKWFGIGLQATPSFNLSDNFKFSYLTTGIYMNGNISRNGKFFWCSNTFMTINKDAKDTYLNYEYIGMCIPTCNGQSITPMIGAIHSWRFDRDLDLALGLYYTIKNWNLYLRGNDLLTSNPRCVAGIEFVY